MKVFIKIDEQETHNGSESPSSHAGCGCGRCDSNYQSYGAGVYEVGHAKFDEALFREYGKNEKSALHSAKMEAEKAGYEIVPGPE